MPRFGGLIGRLSVRSPIIILALIPIIGFVANGIIYISGEGEVGRAFTTVNRSHELADASREFKIAIAAMPWRPRTLPSVRMATCRENCRPDRLDPVGCRRCRAGHRAGQRHHP